MTYKDSDPRTKDYLEVSKDKVIQNLVGTDKPSILILVEI